VRRTQYYHDGELPSGVLVAAFRDIAKMLERTPDNLRFYITRTATDGTRVSQPDGRIEDLQYVTNLNEWYVGADLEGSRDLEVILQGFAGNPQIDAMAPDVETLERVFEVLHRHVGLVQKATRRSPRTSSAPWERVGRALSGAGHALRTAKFEEDFQSVGLLCREALISLAQAVFDPKRHTSPDGVKPSDTDAGRMLEGYFSSALRGESNEAARRHARAALALAVELQHQRTADSRDGALCIEATTSVVNLVTLIEGK